MKPVSRILIIRQSVLATIEGLSLKQLNTVPPGFNNNIIWNIGHMSSVLQRITYFRAGVQGPLPESFIEKFQKGTRPEHALDQAQADEAKEALILLISRLGQDLEAGFFTGYEPWTTGYGLEIGTMEDAVAFTPYHDGMHSGYILALKRLVQAVL